MELKATFKVDTIITKVDKEIPFTSSVMSAGTRAKFATRTRDKYVVHFIDTNGQSLYMEYDLSELEVKGVLESIEQQNINRPKWLYPSPPSCAAPISPREGGR